MTLLNFAFLIWGSVIGIVCGHIITIASISRAKQKKSILSILEQNQKQSLQKARLIGTYPTKGEKDEK